MNCVNRNSKEFKFLAEHNDLSINALELITHKYWLENKTEDYFPSDVYIQAQLGKIPYEEPTKVVRELWDLKYKDSQEFASLEGLEEARKEALRYFPEEAVTYHTNFKGNYVLTIRKPMAKLSIDISDLTGKTTHDGQEQADFNLLVNSLGLNTIQNNIKELQLSISSSQTFTFKDGTTVKAPFKPNYQQEDALNAMDEFINSNRTSMTLSGYAGTGKTSLMEMLAEKMRKQYKPVMFCASTNKAAAVLKERVSKSGFEAQTLNKVFGITVEVDPNKSYNAKNLVNKLKDVDIPYGTTVIIDEASMINEENYNILNNIAKNNGLKIIYVGDAAQLAPVNETKISKVFRDQNHEVRTLSIVERTGDNAILKEATDLRNGKALSGESSFNSKGQGVAYLKPSNTQEREAIIKRFIPELKSNPNYFRILAYTNAAVAAYNTQVRQLLGYNDNIPRVGEPITGYANWGYNWKTKSYKFINSEAYKVVAVQQPKTITKDLPKVGKVSLQIIPITLENSLGEKRDYNLIDVKGNQENRAVAFSLAKAKAELHNTANKLGGRAQIPYRQAANAIEEFLFVNDTLGEKINGKEVAYQTKVFDFGYAMTVHKSQGSTFTHVLMDDVDISKAKDERNIDMGLEDIAIGWEDVANNEPANYEVAGPMEDIDMGDWEDETPSTEGTLIQEAPKAENPNAANIRQQLKYVAVSRATDTVTIISDNVKKEDTPLNHINEAPASQETTQQKPVEQMSSTEVWRYLSAMQPLTKRSQVEYTPKGQERQTYTVENGHIYNSKGTEVYPGKTVHKNMILANHAVKEGLAVVVKHPTSGEEYVVDNNQQITSVKTGKIMEWGEENGDRRRILAQAEKEFRERIITTKERGNTLNDQLLDYLQLMGIDVHNETEMIQYLREHGNKAIQQAIQTAEGEVRGFATPEGSLYFDRTVMSPEHPIHEYTHLWDRVVAKNNPELWNRGITLMKQISLWKDIENDENYGQKWKALKGMTPKKLESLIASEVHSRLVGVNGEQILDRLSKEKGQKGIIGRLKQWLLDFWKDLKGTFSNWSQEDLDKLTLQDFTMMTIRDLADGFNPNTFQQAPAEQTESKQQTIPASYEGMITPDANTIFVFGSNPEGRHGAGAAKTAKEKFGAIYGQGEGLQGNSYALPTKDLRVKENRSLRSISSAQITENIKKMYEVARQNPSKQFKVAYTNGLNEATLNGYTGREMIQMFKDAGPIPPNVVFSKNWTDHWNEVQPSQAAENTSPVTKIISGGQTGVDTIGLQVAKSLGIETGGKAPKGFLRERGIDNEDIASYGLTEITDEEQADYTSRKHKSDPYTGRTELNVRNSDGTVYFYNPEDKAGYIATKRAADEWNKPFIENPTAEELRKWIEDNGIHTLNVAGNRGTKLKNGKEVASIIRDALTKTWSQQDASKQPAQFEYARNANGKPNYEVSSRGDKRFSAMTATFAPGTTLFGHDVGGRTIENVYQNGVKQGQWHVSVGNQKTGAPTSKEIIKGNTEDDSYYQGYLPLWQEWARQNPQLIEELRQKAQGKVLTDMFASTAVSQARALADILNSTINQNNNRSNNKIEYGNDFRRIQETVRRDSQGSSVLRRDIGEDSRRRLARITKLELDSNTSPQRNSQWTGVSSKGVHYNIIGEIPAQLFHDIFEVVRYYTENGELVDLHDDYSSCKCYLSDDGTCGFAIEPDGNLVSVFNLGLNRGFLSAIKDIAIAQGANHLDAFDSNVQPLRKIYEHTLGAKVASSMDYNMEYDHDNIAANHGNPQVVFMVMGKAAEGKIEEKHFNENQYDEAQAYQQSFLPAQQQPTEEPLDTSAIFQNPSSTEVTVEDRMKPWRNDPSKQNISRRIYLKGHKDKGYFEVVKDFEDGYYSVHFKPIDSDNPNAFSKDEKEILFQAVADTIPVDGKLSTWGELSRGGVAGLERFSKLGFAQSGERTVRMKGTDEEINIPVFTKYPDTTTRISLKGYEYFTDAYEDTLVDAPWKIPFLQELDRQFSTENPEGRNEEIVNQMKAILEAKSYEEWQNNTDSKTKEQVQKNLDEYDKLITQLNNLLDSDVITASEVRHVAELVVNAISDNITQLQKEKGLAEQQFPTLNSKLDFQTASRKDIINTIDINRLIHRAKLLFDPEANDYEDLDTIEQADLIIDNWDAIMTLASDIFAANEGVGISRDFDNGGWHSVNGQKIDYDNFNNYENDPDAMAEETKDEQEHWQIEQRTIDILNSMSAMVRLALHECYQVDKDGNIIKSKWGIPERVNARNAVNSILRWTQGSLSLEDMITKLSAKQAQQPWLGQLIERLNDKSGNETDFQSQFYGVFSKHFQLYSVVLLEDGKYHSMTVNSHPALTEAMQTITTQFKVGEHPLFTSRGINKTLLGNEDTTNPKATFNLHKALTEMRLLCDRIDHGEDVNTEIAEIATNNIMGVCRVLGYPVAESMISEIINSDNIKYLTDKLGFIVNSLDKAAEANKKDYDPFAYKKENSIGGSLRNFLTPITDQLEDTATNAFYDSGKMYQSYVTPSFMTKLLQKFRLEGQAFEDFLDSEYGNSEWFKFKGRNGAWRNEWLRMLATNEEARKVFDHKVELNFNKHNYMRNMSDAEYTLSLFAEYFAEGTDDKQSMVPAWFRIPMQSNKPSSEFIKFYSYRGANYKNDITDGMYNMFLQELSRIQTVRMRNLPKNHPSFIKNFDKNGKMFNFLPFLNSYLEDTAAAKKGRNLLDATDSVDENTDFAKILQKKLRGDELSSDEEANLMKYAKKAIYNHMDRRATEILNRWEQEGILEASKQVEGVGKEDADVKNSIENYLWNDAFAAKNILQLTVGDIAFYKDAEDLQKRLAQLHAPGIRGNVNATDYQGNRVSDGYYRTFILQDFDTFRSNIIANITEVFDRKIARAPKSQKAQLEALKDSLVRPPKTNGPDDKGGKYWNINVTDAQGYSSPSSYRKKAFIFGKWSHKAEDIYQKLLSGEYNYTDLEVAFQPLKPFVYTHLKKHMGDGTPIETMNVPFQAKNSEYLLIMADAIMQSEVKESGELSRPNLLRAVYRVMEDSEKANKTKGIDTVQFESAIKSGLQGKMNIHQFAEVAGGEDAAYTFMMSQIYQNYDPAKPLNEQQLQYNTDTFVHEASFEDYCLQQEVPEHFKEHSQAHGSQIRMITPSDLDLYKDPNGNPNDENNINYYEWTEPDGTKRRLRADEFKKEYEQTIADNIAESIENLSKELHLDSLDKKERNIALSKILLREILSSPRYGVDLAQACAVDKNTGEFRIPKGDPIQAKRIEQLINSIIKNRVNKQKIAGGPIVQVTNFGTSKQLHIRFKDNSGKILLTEEEFNNKLKGEAVRIIYKDYKEYLQKEQHGIAYFEVFIPIWANEIFEKFANEDGTIDVKAIEAVDPDLLKMISYRIPTEDKYSCAPMKVVGFMPREAGDAIMLPYELTEIDDSDFDVDKRYVMRKDIQIVENKKAIEKLLIQKVSESYAKAHDGKVNKRFIVEQVKMYMDNPDRMKTADKLMEYIHNQKQLIMKQYKDKVYKTVKPTSGRTYRDNKIVDMTWAVLTNEMTADKILNPGGFDNFKRVGYMVAAYRLKSHEMSWSQLEEKTTDELNDLCYVDKDLTWADTQIQFYKQNAAAASLIGVFAVNKVAHATLEGDDIFLDVAEAINSEEPFTIGGTVFGGRRDTNGNPLMTKEEYDEWITTLSGFKKKDMSYEEYLLLNEDTSQRNRMQVDPKYDREGNLIGKTLGSGVSASADAAKTPVLNLLNINMTTVGTFTSLLRLRMPHEDACMFIGQDIIARILDDFNRQNLTGYASLNSVITKEINRLREKHSITEDSAIDKEPLTKDELIRGLTPDEHEVIDYKVLIAFQKAKAIADSIRKLSFPTRFNSISSAVGPLIIDNLILEHKMEQFMDENGDTHFYTADGVNVDITNIFADHPILNQFSKTVDIAKQMTSDMPAGSTGFRNLLNKIPDDIKEKLYNDKKLFSTLSDFYQSYLAIASGLVNPANLKSYIDGFPKWFMKENFKEKYPDNALIQAIQMTVSKRTGRAFLTIKLTGEDETVKESYRNAWIDLHKTNPELSQQLFEYCFFRAGIGFSPKTFMAVVPTYVKERLQRQLPNGEKATYLDTYRKFPSVPEEVLFDQFIANNWEDNKLVPRKGGKNSHFIIKGTELYATTPEDIADLEGLSYIKTSGKGETYLWKKVSGDENEIHYTQIKPLGNNGEYLEISLNRIDNPMTATTQTSENNDASEIKTTSTSETDATEEKQEPLTTENKRAKAIAALARDYMTYIKTNFNRKISDLKAVSQAEDMVGHPERFGSLMQNILKAKGIEMSKEEAIKKLKELNLC